MLKFAKLVEQNVTTDTRSIWYPEADSRSRLDKIYIQENSDEEEPGENL
jgi:hypothetical protein